MSSPGALHGLIDDDELSDSDSDDLESKLSSLHQGLNSVPANDEQSREVVQPEHQESETASIVILQTLTNTRGKPLASTLLAACSLIRDLQAQLKAGVGGGANDAGASNANTLKIKVRKRFTNYMTAVSKREMLAEGPEDAESEGSEESEDDVLPRANRHQAPTTHAKHEKAFTMEELASKLGTAVEDGHTENVSDSDSAYASEIDVSESEEEVPELADKTGTGEPRNTNDRVAEPDAGEAKHAEVDGEGEGAEHEQPGMFFDYGIYEPAKYYEDAQFVAAGDGGEMHHGATGDYQLRHSATMGMLSRQTSATTIFTDASSIEGGVKSADEDNSTLMQEHETGAGSSSEEEVKRPDDTTPVSPEQKYTANEGPLANTLGGIDEVELDVETLQRVGWNEQWQRVIELPETTPDQAHKKYVEMTRICTDFVNAASAYGEIIVREYHLPLHQKTIAPLPEDGLLVGFQYSVNGILFRLAEDAPVTDSLHAYGDTKPSHENARKVAGHSLRATMCLLSYFLRFVKPDEVATAPRVPLTAVIDYHGYRLVAMPWLPIARGSLVYGSADGGDTFVNNALESPSHPLHEDFQRVETFMANASEFLHLAPHFSKSGCLIYTGADVQVIKGADDRYYIVDMARSFPPQDPSKVSHLPQHTQDIFYRFFRPEFLQLLKSKGRPSLSVDAFSAFTPEVRASGEAKADEEDADEEVTQSLYNNVQVAEATVFLLEDVIPAFAKDLNEMQDKEAAELLTSIPAALHSRGINIRHCGLLRSLVHSNAVAKQQLLRTILGRTAKNVLRFWLRTITTEYRLSDPSEFVLRFWTSTFLRLLCGSHALSSRFWQRDMMQWIEKRFGLISLDESEKVDLYAAAQPHLHAITIYILEQTGLKLSAACRAQFDNNPVRFPFSVVDVLRSDNKIKHMMLNYSRGKLYLNFAAHGVSDMKSSETARRHCTLATDSFNTAILDESLHFLALRDRLFSLALARELSRHYAEADEVLIAQLQQPSVASGTFGDVLPMLIDVILQIWESRARRCHGFYSGSAGSLSSLLEVKAVMKKMPEQTLLQSRLDKVTAAYESVLRAVLEAIRSTKRVNEKDAELQEFRLKGALAKMMAEDTAPSLAEDEDSRAARVQEVFAKLYGDEVPRNANAIVLRTALRVSSNGIDWSSLVAFEDLFTSSHEGEDFFSFLLLAASEDGNEQLVSELLLYGVSPSVAMARHAFRNPLHLAVLRGHVPVLNVLVEAKANSSQKDSHLNTPLHLAVHHSQQTMASLLIQSTSDLNTVNKNGKTPLMIAVQQNSPALSTLLLEAKADANIASNTNETPLHVSCLKGFGVVTESLIQYGADVSKVDQNGHTPVHLAIEYGHMDIAKQLVEAKCDVNAVDSSGNSPLHLASERNQLALVKHLLSAQANPNLQNKGGASCVFLAVQHGRIEVVSYLLEQGADANLKASGGETSLHCAAKKADEKICKLLLHFGADPNLEDDEGKTVLHATVLLSSTQIAGYLIEAKANLDSKARSQNSILHDCVIQSNKTLLGFLLDAKAAPSPQAANGQTPLHMAIALKRPHLSQLLVEASAELNARDDADNTPLHTCAISGDTRTAKLLLDHKADPDASNSSNQLPLHTAIISGNPEVAKQLIVADCDVGASDNNGNTALHIAAERDLQTTTAILLRHGADMNQRNNLQQTPLYAGARHSRVNIVSMLLDANADPNVITSEGETALQVASLKGDTRMTQVLLQSKALPDAGSVEGRSLLAASEYTGRGDIAQLLREQVPDTKEVSNETKQTQDDDEDAIWAIFQEGATFIKHGRDGKAKPKMLYVTKSYVLCWCDVNKRPADKNKMSSKNMPLKNVTILEQGKRTELFSTTESAMNAPDDLCMSIGDKNRTLDVQAGSVEQRDEWYRGIQYLLAQLELQKPKRHVSRRQTWAQ